MKPIIELLKTMRGRLPLFVGSNSIGALAMFLRGYSFASETSGLGQEDKFLSAFQEMVQKRYAVKISKSWEQIIMFQCCDDNEAIEVFWRLFDEFVKVTCGKRKPNEVDGAYPSDSAPQADNLSSASA